MTGKQRSALRARAAALPAILQVGKGGLSDAVLKQLDEALEARELIKLTLLKNSGLEARTLIDELAVRLRAEPVQAVGYRIVLYRYSHRKDIRHVEF